MFLNKLKTFAHLLGSAALAVLALYGVIGIFSNAGLAFGAPSAVAPMRETALVDDASVPLLLNYQGTLRDVEGNPLSGYYTVTFRLYDDIIALPENAIWSEQHISVTVRSGHFSALLGNTASFSATIFNSPDCFIGVTVAPYDEMVPRQRFASVPCAIYADRAFSLSAADGDPHDAVYVDADGDVGIGTDQPETYLHLQADPSRPQLRLEDHNGFWQLWGGGNYSIHKGDDTGSFPFIIRGDTGNVGIGAFDAQSTLTVYSTDAEGWASGIRLLREDGGQARILADGSGLKFRAYGADDSFWFRNAANTTLMEIQDNGNIGIGTTSPGAKLDVNGNTNVNGNLTVSGNITNFAVEGPVEITSFNGADTQQNLGSTSQRICFLTRAGFGDLTGGGDNNVCRIDRSGTQWRLTADSAGSGNVFCSATCLSW